MDENAVFLELSERSPKVLAGHTPVEAAIRTAKTAIHALVRPCWSDQLAVRPPPRGV
jgi:hypothetical protein